MSDQQQNLVGLQRAIMTRISSSATFQWPLWLRCFLRSQPTVQELLCQLPVIGHLDAAYCTTTSIANHVFFMYKADFRHS
jgi:hypothetical protein